MRHNPLLLAAFLISSIPAVAAAQPFAEPPDGDQPIVASGRPYDSYDHPYAPPEPYPYYGPHSTVRIHTGPVMRISDDPVAGGLFAAINVGEKAAGVRFSGAWVRVGGSRGLSQYAGELWLDFNHLGPLHPILGAGAGASVVELDDGAGGTKNHTIGVGLLRGTLQYRVAHPRHRRPGVHRRDRCRSGHPRLGRPGYLAVPPRPRHGGRRVLTMHWASTSLYLCA